MKNRASNGLIIRLAATCMVFAIALSSSAFVLAASTAKSLSAEIIISGLNFNSDKSSVTLNGERVINGHTFQAGGVIATSETGSAVINLGKLGRISVSPNTSLNLTFSENNISGDLTSGQVKVFNNEGVSVNIHTADNEVTNNAALSNFTVDVTSGSTKASSEVGNAFMKNGMKAPQNKDDDDDDDKGGLWIPIVVFAGAVGAAVILIATNSGDDSDLSPVSPVR